MFVGKKPNLCNMHVFGSVCYTYTQNKKKLDPRSNKAIFLGYARRSPAYSIYYPETGSVKEVRCVKFLDKCDVSENTFEHVHIEDTGIIGGMINSENIECGGIENHTNEDENIAPTDETQNEENTEEMTEHETRRERRKPKYLDDYVTNDDFANYTIDYCYRVNDIPKSYQEAVDSNESEQWKEAMVDEITALKQNDTYELTPVKESKNVVGGRWVYAVKVGPDGGEKFKARYVAKGFSQIQDIDYKETFAPTARLTSIRMLMQLAVQENMIVEQMDVKTAYLNAPIDCEIYVEQPEGFAENASDDTKLVCRLKKSLYGLKQSGRNWNNMLHTYLKSEDFEQSLVDNCVYTRIADKIKTIIIVWVDDIIIACNTKEEMKRVKDSLCQKFKMTDLNELTWFLGIKFNCDNRDCIEMNQAQYVNKLLERFNMLDCKPKATPCDLAASKIRDEESSYMENPKAYREIVGSLIYVMSGTRPDLCYAVTKLSQHMSKPTFAHFKMAKHVLRYLKGTVNLGLKFEKSQELNLFGYSDSDWGGSMDRCSISGYAFQLNCNGPLISWKSKKQQCVALSTCEAEYIAACNAVQEAKFLGKLWSDMMGNSQGSILLHVDNQGAIALAKNPVYHQRSKHIDIKYHFIRSEVQRGSIDLKYVASENNVADVFTKPVSKRKLAQLLDLKLVT